MQVKRRQVYIWIKKVGLAYVGRDSFVGEWPSSGGDLGLEHCGRHFLHEPSACTHAPEEGFCHPSEPLLVRKALPFFRGSEAGMLDMAGSCQQHVSTWGSHTQASSALHREGSHIGVPRDSEESLLQGDVLPVRS